MSQKEITESTKLLNEDGTLNTVGWARHNYFEYDRRSAKPRSRVKEWDFYCIKDSKYYVVLAFFNITLASSAFINVWDIETGKKVISKGPVILFTRHKCILPRVSDVPNFFRYESDNIVLQFDTRRNCKKLEFVYKVGKNKKIEANFVVDVNKEYEGITTSTPLVKPNQYFLANKLFGMRTEGVIKVDGKEFHKFSKDNTFTTMDWGRGLWPSKAVWYWANGVQEIDGNVFGFNFTWAINKNTPDLETCLLYNGKIHKLGAVDVEKFPKENGFMNEWHIKSEDGRFDAVMQPTFDNSSKMILGMVGQNVDQVFGKWTGYAILDDGTKIEFKDMFAFCEYVESKW